jgi:hypothetical protein
VPSERIAKAVGLVLGLAVVAGLLGSWRVARGGPVLGTDLHVVAVAPGELTLATGGSLLAARAMRPGAGAVTGSARVRNIAGRPLLVRVRALPSERGLGGALRAEATLGGHRMVLGAMAGMGVWSTRAVRLAAGATQTLALRTWLDPGARDALEGRVLRVALELRAEVAL